MRIRQHFDRFDDVMDTNNLGNLLNYENNENESYYESDNDLIYNNVKFLYYFFFDKTNFKKIKKESETGIEESEIRNLANELRKYLSNSNEEVDDLKYLKEINSLILFSGILIQINNYSDAVKIYLA